MGVTMEINTNGLLTKHDDGWDPHIADFVRIDDGFVWFKWRDNQAMIRINKISNNELEMRSFHHPPSTSWTTFTFKRY